MKALIQTQNTTFVQGDMYEINGEDDKLCVADVYLIATTIDGAQHRLRQPIRGYKVNGEGCAIPVSYDDQERSAKNMIAKINARGDIDVDLWDDYVAPSSYSLGECDESNLAFESDQRQNRV